MCNNSLVNFQVDLMKSTGCRPHCRCIVLLCIYCKLCYLYFILVELCDKKVIYNLKLCIKNCYKLCKIYII